jgi:hypothetical protein
MLRFMVTLDWFLIPEGSGEGHATGIPRRIEPDDEETDPDFSRTLRFRPEPNVLTQAFPHIISN